MTVEIVSRFDGAANNVRYLVCDEETECLEGQVDEVID